MAIGLSDVAEKFDNALGVLGAYKSEIIVGAAAATVGAGVGIAATALASSKKSRKRKSKAKIKRRRSNKRRVGRKRSRSYSGYARTAGKGKDTSHRRIRMTKNGQPYVILASGKARFIKKSSAKNSRRRKGGRY